jgi:hypothetical protein
MDHMDVAADAVALNVSAFIGSRSKLKSRSRRSKLKFRALAGVPLVRKNIEAHQSTQAAAQPPLFVVEPRVWGQTRAQYFSALWALSGRYRRYTFYFLHTKM